MQTAKNLRVGYFQRVYFTANATNTLAFAAILPGPRNTVTSFTCLRFFATPFHSVRLTPHAYLAMKQFHLISLSIELTLLLAGLTISVYCNAQPAKNRSTPSDAIAHVKRAIVYIKQFGIPKAFTEFNRSDSAFNTTSTMNPHGDLYMLVYQFDGTQPVHGKNPNIIGKNVYEMRDKDGVYLIKDMINTCKSNERKGWVHYQWPDSITGKMMAKQTYVERFADYCIGTGIYKTQ